MRLRLAVAASFVGAIGLQGFMGPAVEGLRMSVGLIALIFIACLGYSSHSGRTQPLRAIAFLALAAGMLLLRGSFVQTTLFALAIGVIGPSGIVRASGALLMLNVMTAFQGWLPFDPRVGERLATFLGNQLQGGPEAVVYGPSALGLPAAAWALGLAAVAVACRFRSVAAWVGLLCVPVAVLLQLPIGEYFYEAFHPHRTHGHPLDPPGIFFSLLTLSMLLTVAVAIAWRGEPAVEVVDEEAEEPKASPGRGRLLSMGALGLLGGALAMVLLTGWRAQEAPDRRVAYLNMGGLDWERPVYGEYGGWVGGMFGITPVYLQQAGWDVSVVEEEELPEFGLDDARVLVLVNCHKVWTEPERLRLEAFVDEGGSILILGDHTDVFGLMKGFNSLMHEWGIEFLFDSAYHPGKGWQQDLEWKPGMLGLWDHTRQHGLAVGASLKIQDPARSIIQARYGFSDIGIRENVMGSFLGNYTYERGERLGDMVMVAGLRIGNGRIVVYGDTSGYQNGGMPFSYPELVDPLLSELSRAATFSIPLWLEELLELIIVLGLTATVVLRVRGTWATWTGFGAATVAAAALTIPAPESATIQRADLSNAMLLDYSHLPDVGHYDAGWNTTSSLYINAHRGGLLGWKFSEWDGDAVKRARVTAIVAPRKPISASEADDLQAAMQGGSTVIVAASGAQHSANAAPLLARSGVQISPASMGRIPQTGRQEESEPRFVDASELLFAPNANYESVYRYGDRVIAAALPVGEGHLLVIGDSRFYDQGNVEGIWGWWPGNIRFQHDLLYTYCGANPESVEEVFAAPKRPEE